ncbi:MAG TPA: DUF4384 domain-containing protein [Anaeromyxobacteraceae bacterium]|jgi:hypothetical protein
MSQRHPSALSLERHLADPVGSPVRDHIALCARCSEQLEEMRRQGEEFLRTVYPATVEAVEAAAARRWLPSWLRVPVLAPVTAAAAAAAVLLLLSPAGDGLPPDWGGGVKGFGGVGLAVFGNGGGGARLLGDGEVVRADAALRFRVSLPSPCHLWIVSVDAQGKVSRLFPSEGDGGALAAGRVELPGGAVLDGRPGPERVLAVCTPGPLLYAPLERAVQVATAQGAGAVRALAKLPWLPEGSGQASVLLEKR